VGKYLLHALMATGEKPVIYDLRPNCKVLQSSLGYTRVVKGDILNLKSLSDTIRDEQVGTVVHMASLLTSTCESNPPLAATVNVGGTVNVLEAARKGNVRRVVYTSSVGVYGSISKVPVKEEHPTKPQTIYGATKRSAEVLGLMYARTYGLDFIALRFPPIYGPGGGRSLGSIHSTISEVVEKSLVGQHVELSWEPFGKVDFVYVRDAVQALMKAVQATKPRNRIYNASYGRCYTPEEVASGVKRFLSKASIKCTVPAENAKVLGPFDIQKARHDLLYEPHYDIERGIEDYLDELKRGRMQNEKN
jgi:UDP-glucose 4-epimerase